MPADVLGVSRAKVSNHLACLRGCGLVRATREGRQVRFELARVVLHSPACPVNLEARR